MSLKILALTFIVFGLCYYAWFRSWFVALCGSIVLLSVLQHPDMPRSIAGVQGLNLWNILFINVGLAWLFHRRREGLTWDMPQSLAVAFLLYFAVVIGAALRLIMSPSPYVDESVGTMLFNTLVNPIKFFIPCLLLYDGCRTRERTLLATGCIIFVYFFFGVQIIKYLGLDFSVSGSEMEYRSGKINREIGFHRVDMSMMMAGASWAALAFSQMFTNRLVRLSIWGAAGIIIVGQALTAGRAGYMAWACIGIFFCVVRWRKLIPIAPFAVLALMIMAPGIRERLLTGIGQSSGPIQVQSDNSEITAGRSDVWPYVIKEIQKSPVIGNGREGMKTTGLTDFTRHFLNDPFAHPHNAYLEMLLDNGLIGLLSVMPLFFLAWWRSLSLFVDKTDRLYQAVGGIAMALLMALLIAGLGAQTLYPREGVVTMWASVGIALRVYQERLSARRHAYNFRPAPVRYATA